MFYTWLFRALFVPLLVLAIITSNCGGAESVDAAGTELGVVVCMLLNDPLTFAARLCRLWWKAYMPWTSPRVCRGCDLLLEYL